MHGNPSCICTDGLKFSGFNLSMIGEMSGVPQESHVFAEFSPDFRRFFAGFSPDFGLFWVFWGLFGPILLDFVLFGVSSMALKYHGPSSIGVSVCLLKSESVTFWSPCKCYTNIKKGLFVRHVVKKLTLFFTQNCDL